MASPLALLGRALSGRRSDERRSIVHAPGLQTSGSLTLSSPDFADGAPMPIQTTAYGANLSPALTWAGVPEGTAQLVLVMEDIDVPVRTPVVHTVAVLPPTVTGIARGGLAEAAERFLKVMMGRTGYQGPQPIPGHGPHRYRFHLYALDAPLPAATERARDLPDAVAGHVLAVGTVTGTYEKS